MSNRWPNKDPDEVLDYSIDWSRFLRSPATIQSVQWFVDDEDRVKTAFTPVNVVNGLQAVATTNTPTVATIVLGLGTANRTYRLHCRMSDTQGRIAERVVLLPIKER
jgi:hypothetical protein